MAPTTHALCGDNHSVRSTPATARVEDTTFCIVDVETTGGTPRSGAITEIGAVLTRGGQQLATFATLVDPGQPIDPWVEALTGITNASVAGAPPFHRIIDAFTDFVSDAVIVGHNIRFDLGCLGTAFEQVGRKRLTNRSLCTLALARRMLRDEVPDCTLHTLATMLRLEHQPSQRALDDALATVDLLHALLERAPSWGASDLDDLFQLPKLAGHPHASKLRLTDSLPHGPGVYLFRGRDGGVLYVGKASDLRSRVRSYFGTNERRKVQDLLAQTTRIDHECCVNPLAAGVREIELIQHYVPKFNSRSTRWKAMTYLALPDGSFPRFSVVRTIDDAAVTHLGPLASVAAARRVEAAITSVVPLHRCPKGVTTPAAGSTQLELPGIIETSPGSGPCLPAQLGVAVCPCSGRVTAEQYRHLVETVRRGITRDPGILLGPIRARLAVLSQRHQFEEAAKLRDGARELAAALARQRRLESWGRPHRIVVERDDGAGAELVHGRLERAWDAQGNLVTRSIADHVADGAILRSDYSERMSIVTELERVGSPWHIVRVDGALEQPAVRIETFMSSDQDRAMYRR